MNREQIVLILVVLSMALAVLSCGGQSSPKSKSVVLTSDPTQMFAGDSKHLQDIVIATFPAGTKCTERSSEYFDIGTSSLVKYGYLTCGSSAGWVNAKWYR